MKFIRAQKLLGLSLLSMAAACGGGGSGDSAPATVSVAISDSASDEIESFVVEISAVQLMKPGGAVVSVLPAPVTVDLATLTDTAQILNVLDVPPGLYNSGTITIDFTNSSVVLVGHTTPAAIHDTNGSTLMGQLAFPMQFGNNPVNAIAGRHRLLEFDFDLDQSVEVDTAGNVVTLEPTFVLRNDPTDKQVLVVGTLSSVDTSAETFVADVRSFSGTLIGSATFANGGSTVYQVDGVSGTSTTGLALLNAKPAGTWIQVYGRINGGSKKITADFIEAGSGTYNGGTDIVEGHIVDRTGPAGSNATLTVLGRSNNAMHTILQFNTMFTVQVNHANTKVVRLGLAQAFDTDDLNIGQRVRVFGTLAGTTVDATSATSIVREQPALIFGHASGAIGAGTLTMDLNRVDLRPDNAFMWSSGGTSPANHNAFTVAVGSLGSGLTIGTDTAVVARGYFSAVDDNNEDFVASSLTNLDQAPALMFVRDRPGGFTVTPTTSATQIQLVIVGVAGAGEQAVIDRGFAGPMTLPTVPAPTIVPPLSGDGLYTLRDMATGAFTVYVHFSDFSSAVGLAVAQAADLKQIGAFGNYNAVTNTIEAGLASAVIE